MGVKSIIKTPVKKVLQWYDAFWEERNIKILYKSKTIPAYKCLAVNPSPALSDNQIKEIDQYWAQYGIKILDYSWFQCYYGVTGIYDPRFIPQDIYSYIIWPYYNNEEFCLAWKDKNMFERFCPGVPFLHNYLRKIHGRYFDGDNNFLPTRRAVIDVLREVGDVIVKDAWNSGEGRGVKKYSINCNEDAERLVNEWDCSDNYLVQELLVQNQVFSQFNSSSVNIMRINSWRNGDVVNIFSPALRFGIEGKTTDVCFINGVEIANVCAITMDGHFGDRVINQYGQSRKISDVIQHPDVVIPRWDEVLEIVKESHKKLDHFDIIGWDFTVTEDDRIVCVEYNIKRPGTVFYQFLFGPFFGIYTEEVLAFLKNVNNQKNGFLNG